MAIPDNIYKLEVTGHWEYQGGPVPVVRWPFALTWWVRSTEVTDDPARLAQYANEFAIWLIKGQAGVEFVSDGTVVTKQRGIRLASEAFGEDLAPLAATLTAFRAVPPQVALLVIGRTNVLGRQTRKWIPCISSGFLEGDQPRWNVSVGGAGSLREWAWDGLTPKNAGPGVTLTPVVWDPVAEEASDIMQVRLQAWPRTIRRRSLRAPDEWLTMP